jgi:hypothetical protein
VLQFAVAIVDTYRFKVTFTLQIHGSGVVSYLSIAEQAPVFFKGLR